MLRRASSIPHVTREWRRICREPSIRYSSQLLGHSPMAQPNPFDSSGGAARIPTARDAEISGVWQATSAKRDKLGELKGEAAGTGLDQMATEAQRIDLHVVDGLLLIVKTATEIGHAGGTEWMDSIAANFDDNLVEAGFYELLDKLSQEIQQRLSQYPPERCFSQVEDFFDTSQLPEKDRESWVKELEISSGIVQTGFDDSVSRVQLLHAEACVQHLKASWSTYTSPTDQDIDRMAVQQKVAEPLTTLEKRKVMAVVTAHLQGTGEDRVSAVWDLVDHDNDALLDQIGMEKVLKSLLATSQSVVPVLFQDTLRAKGPPVGSWLQRRRQTRHTKLLVKDLQKTIRNHFELELEINHRLRCIYAWANKKHQDNKIDSVVVEEEGGIVTGVMGRKRYVELHPKISVEEFREVQSIHFPHTDRMTQEYLQSFRDELLVRQGKGRQRQELMRDGSLFFVVVSVADYIILSL